MQTIYIPKGKLIELIDNKECSFNDRETYLHYTFITDSNSRIEQNKIYISFADIADLLFDRYCNIDYDYQVIVV